MLPNEIHSYLPEGYILFDYPQGVTITKGTVLHLKCPKGHDWKTARIGNIEKGSRCLYCNKEKKSLDRTTNVEEFRSRLLNIGYELISDFKGYIYKVTIKCIKCNNIRTSLPYNITESCKSCTDIERKNGAILKLKNRLQETGYVLLNDTDTTVDVSKIRLHLCCNNGHEYWTGYKCFVEKGSLCKQCLQLARLDLNQIRLRLDPGYQVDGVYINETSPLVFTCPKGTIYTSNWNKYQRGFRCYCCRDRLPFKLKPEAIKRRLSLLNLKWIGVEKEYLNACSFLTVQCTKNEKHAPFKKKFLRMYETRTIHCPECQNKYTGKSLAEREIEKYLRSLDIKVDPNNRDLGFEIDLLLPEYSLGIEYNGLFFHNEKKKESDYHLVKWEKAKENGIDLITIFEDEYLANPKKVFYYFKHLLCENIKVDLSECSCVEIERDKAEKFYSMFCMIEKTEPTASKIKYFGLVYNSKLIFLVSFYRNQENLHIDRYAFDFEYKVTSGVEHILNKIHYRYFDITRIVFNFDRRYPTYRPPDFFTYKESIPPKFYLVKGRKRKLVHLVEDTVGWVKIYDCGHETWISPYRDTP